ncbi:MAG TPA: hypothetical protein PLN85_00790 [archaeon]|jgi:hypothetical protein|nr:hypothetical protein [archaeon]
MTLKKKIVNIRTYYFNKIVKIKEEEKKLQDSGGWKRNVNPQKGYINWWENICKFYSRSRMKQIWKNEIKNELLDCEL